MSVRNLLGMLTLGVACQTGCSTEAAGGGSVLVGGSSATPTGGQGNSSISAAPQGATSNRTSELGGEGGVFGQGGATTNLGGRATLGGTSSQSSGGSASGGTLSAGGASRDNSSSTAGGTKATGGNAAGGKPSGGTASTGTTTGGKSTGGTLAGFAGAAKGGATVGGTAAGGVATSGVATGGVATGGVSSGGATSNGTPPIKVWIAGDSTVQNCSSACPCGWGSQFDALFNTNVTVVNSAVGGRSVQTWLYEGNVSSTKDSNGECALTSTAYNTRWTNMTNATSGMKPGDYLFIQFGINDGDSACPRHVGTALYKTYLAMMAKAAKAARAQPIFLTPTSAISCSGSNAVATRGFLTETKAAGTENDVPVIDLHQLSINLYNQLTLCPNSDDYTSTTSKVGLFFCEDHTHFEAAGAKQIAQVVAQALRDQGIGLAAYLL